MSGDSQIWKCQICNGLVPETLVSTHLTNLHGITTGTNKDILHQLLKPASPRPVELCDILNNGTKKSPIGIFLESEKNTVKVTESPQRSSDSSGKVKVTESPQRSSDSSGKVKVTESPQRSSDSSGQVKVTNSPQRSSDSSGQVKVTESPQRSSDSSGKVGLSRVETTSQQCRGASKYLIGFMKTFPDFGTFERSFNEYCKTSYTHVRKKDSKNNPSEVDQVKFPKMRVLYTCVYENDPKTIKNRSQGKGLRPRQSYFASNCPFKLFLSYSKKERCYIIKQFNPKHEGHGIDKITYESHPIARRLSSSLEEKFAHYMEGMSVAKHTVKSEIKRETGKNLTTQDLANMIQRQKLTGLVNDIEATLHRLEQERLKDPHCCLKILYDETAMSKVVKCIFWQSGKMKELMKNFGSVIFMDTTYNLTNRGYGLVTVSVIDNHDDGKLIAWALVSEETKHLLSSVLLILRDFNEDSETKIQYVIIDKDFSEIASLSEILPKVHFVICRYHALKAVKKRIYGMHLPSAYQHFKHSLFQHFNSMLYSSSEDKYQKAWDAICSVAPGNAIIEECKTYLETFWHNVREHWAFYILRKEQLFDSFTNNRAEALHKQLKDHILKHSKFEKVIGTVLTLSENQTAAQSIKNFESKNKVYCPTNICDEFHKEIISLGNLMVSKKVLSCLEDQYLKSKFVNLSKLNLAGNQESCPKPDQCKYYV